MIGYIINSRLVRKFIGQEWVIKRLINMLDEDEGKSVGSYILIVTSGFYAIPSLLKNLMPSNYPPELNAIQYVGIIDILIDIIYYFPQINDPFFKELYDLVHENIVRASKNPFLYEKARKEANRAIFNLAEVKEKNEKHMFDIGYHKEVRKIIDKIN